MIIVHVTNFKTLFQNVRRYLHCCHQVGNLALNNVRLFQLSHPPPPDVQVRSPSLVLKGVLRSFFILDILNVLIPESTLFFTRTQTEQICLRYPHPPVASPENGFGDIRRSVEKPLQCLQLLRHKRLTNVLQCTVINPRNQTTARTTRV